jgi:hypothetical protein
VRPGNEAVDALKAEKEQAKQCTQVQKDAAKAMTDADEIVRVLRDGDLWYTRNLLKDQLGWGVPWISKAISVLQGRQTVVTEPRTRAGNLCDHYALRLREASEGPGEATSAA